MAICTITRDGRQSKSLQAKQVVALLRKGRVDESDTVSVRMTVGEFARSAFAREQALAEALTDQRQRLETLKDDHATLKSEYERLKRDYGAAETHTDTLAMWSERRLKLQQECDWLEEEIDRREDEMTQLKSKIRSVPDEIAALEVGIEQREFTYEAPESYRRAMDQVTEQKKGLLKAGDACRSQHSNWTVDGSHAKGKKMIKEQCDLMLRGFNGEVDTALSKVKHGNLDSISKRVNRAFDAINKLGQAKGTAITIEYLDLVLKELRLTNEWEVLKQEQKEREREIKAQMREEAKAEKEIEKARADAEKQEHLKQKALENARAELLAQHGEHNDKLQSLVTKLELELKDAIDRKSKAIARAQLTKSGHVYIISNIGTMGEGVFKIGMTRRLVPQERVDELGDASVPFPFDVHAMIYTTDAPALENALHKKFEARMLNKVNRRREFFQVSLDELRAAVAELHADVTWVIKPVAAQFRESRRMSAAMTDATPSQTTVNA